MSWSPFRRPSGGNGAEQTRTSATSAASTRPQSTVASAPSSHARTDSATQTQIASQQAQRRQSLFGQQQQQHQQPQRHQPARAQEPTQSRAATATSRAPHAHHTSNSTSANANAVTTQASRAAREQRERSRWQFSDLSTARVPDSLWYAEDFLLGAGMVVIQPSSGKIVLIHERYDEGEGGARDAEHWFLPKGRKDVGESLEETALREAYEESGYRVSFLPIILTHNAPEGPLGTLDRNRLLPVTEPFFISTMAYRAGQGGRSKHAGEYITFWYVGQIAEDAVPESGTRMKDEVNYETHLLTHEEAMQRLADWPNYRYMVDTAYALWQQTVELQAKPEYKRYVAQVEKERGKRRERAEAQVQAQATATASVPAPAPVEEDRMDVLDGF